MMRWLFIPLLFLLVGPAQAAYDPAADIKAFGAVCNGTVDDGVKINNAINSNFTVIWGPDGQTCRSSVTIIVPWGKTLRGDNTSNLGYADGHPGGFTIKCDVGVSPCVKTGGSLIGVGVDRPSSGSAGTVGVAVQDGQNVTLQNVMSYRSAIGFQIGGAGGGLGAYLDRVGTCVISDTHLLIAGWAETRVNQSRFGCNGAFDVGAMNYIKVSGGSSDTLTVVNTQFNEGHAGFVVGCWLRFANTAGSLWFFNGIHVEVVKNGVCSDSGAAKLDGLQISNSDFYGGFGSSLSECSGIAGNEFFKLAAGATLDHWRINNTAFTGWGCFTLAPSAAFTDLLMSNSLFEASSPQGMKFVGITGSMAALTGNRWNNLTLQGVFKNLSVSGVAEFGVDNTATGPMSINIPGQSNMNCSAMALKFGGGSTGIVYQASTPQCSWSRQGNTVTVSFLVGLTNKGSSTGAATLIGLPYGGPATGVGNGSTVLQSQNLSGLNGAAIASTATGQPSLNLYQSSMGSGLVGLSDANFTNTSIIQGTVVYQVDAGS